MNKLSYIKSLTKKAGIIVCLFCVSYYPADAQDWIFSEPARQAYHKTLNLQFPGAQHAKTSESAEDAYIKNLGAAIHILLTEDKSLLPDFERTSAKHLQVDEGARSAEHQFLAAEIHLQRAFVYLKFGEDSKAALSLRQASKISYHCRNQFPNFAPIKKTTGLLHVIVGSVPEKYTWILSLLGIKGSVETGLQDLKMVSTSASTISIEAQLLYGIVHTFILQKPSEGFDYLMALHKKQPQNPLLSFVTASAAIKASRSKIAGSILDSLNSTSEAEIPYKHYLHGESLLHSGDYSKALAAYNTFLANYKGENYLKDANYKIGICYFLQGKKEQSTIAFDNARKVGIAIAEADKHALKTLNEDELPNTKLLRVRYYTDGGFFEEAHQAIDQISPTDLVTRKDQVEYYYRRARLVHKENKLKAATLFYLQTIEMTYNENWYFAPNSCLQLGYIYSHQGNLVKARIYFNRALSYKNYEYKNSIDGKAKSALNQIERR